METIKLNNEVEIPVIGLGTWKATAREVYDAVLTAIDAGYRHIDTAAAYENEEDVGLAIKDSQIAREDLFVTSKLWNTESTYDEVIKAFDKTLTDLKLEYLDLYLMHWPGDYERNAEVWKAMEDLNLSGKIKSIGVSNFNIHHLDVLLKTANIKPVVNQVECHIKYQNNRLAPYCMAKGLYMEAYAPLMSWKIGELLEDETLTKVAKKYNKSNTQIALKWLIQRSIIPLPKSVSPVRIKENIDIFDFQLDDDDMAALRLLNNGKRLFPEPDNVDFGFMDKE